MSTARPAEAAAIRAAPFLFGGVAAALPLLLVPSDVSRLTLVTVHLSLLVVLALGLSLRLAALVHADWFIDRKWVPRRRRLAGAVYLIGLVTLVVGLVTLVTSAALRLQPSLQFLQLLSALDIAWAVAALVIGAHVLAGRTTALLAGVVLDVVCVAALWNYLRVVGFEADGGWLLDGSRLMQLVIPADMVAAVLALLVLGLGLRRLDQPMEQASDQS